MEKLFYVLSFPTLPFLFFSHTRARHTLRRRACSSFLIGAARVRLPTRSRHLSSRHMSSQHMSSRHMSRHTHTFCLSQGSTRIKADTCRRYDGMFRCACVHSAYLHQKKVRLRTATATSSTLSSSPNSVTFFPAQSSSS